MGKAQIISGGTDGLYSVKLLFNKARAEDRIGKYNDQITHLDTIIPGLETALDDAQTALDAATSDLDTAITAHRNGEITYAELMEKVRAANQAGIAYRQADISLKTAKLQKASLEKQVSTLTARIDEPIVDAWCADLTEDLSGIVATAEIAGERQRPVIIRPGYGDNAAWDFRKDGQLQPIMSAVPEAALYNCGVFPGWQKWMPTYRLGKILKRYISGDHFTFDVLIDDEYSTAQGFDINWEPHPILEADYMETDSMAFEVGDRVLIQYEDQDRRKPKIIGFESMPRRCEAIWYLKITRDDGTVMTDEHDMEFTVKASDSSFADSVDSEYDGDPDSGTYQYWKVTAHWYPYKEIDPDGYWLTIGCEDSIGTQYPYRYKEADKHQAGDRIKPGVYQAAVPYWKVEYETTIGKAVEVLPGEFFWEIDHHEEQHKKYIVKSSIPYRTVTTLTRDDSWYRWLIAHYIYYKQPGDPWWWPDVDYISDWGGAPMVSQALIEGDGIYQNIDGIAASVTNQEVISYFNGSLSGQEHILSVTNNTPSTYYIYDKLWLWNYGLWKMLEFEISVEYEW